ncbi:phosphoribosylglycinamide formyltransferase [Porphyromonadaceae bacterium OttesenSCG-928-L07]|nr:phosphoribosylglycinamide formyltransferase [Porphyromonadaceae bacterium OttesenSCG-928-L07]MDL2330574.1 phosphoribosylglycinamide formyltransferase [Odoribacter sp. OttesenSCG-928-A06]
MKKIAIFASGSGSNAENIISFFQDSPDITVDSVYCNVPDAYVLERAKKWNIPAHIFTREELKTPEKVLKQLQESEVDYIVLAGFLWLIPSFMTAVFPNRIINIHPALLPQYGGKGMYGMNVHRAVIEAGEKQSGITIHYVNEQYDKGDIIFQATCKIETGDTPEMLAEKIHELEYAHFPQIIQETIK